MVAVNLVFKKLNAQIDAVTLDVSLNENHQSESEITEHPVEQGVNIVDHARPKPKVLTMEGVVTNTPIPGPNDPLVRRTQGDVVYDSRAAMQPTRAGEAYQALLDLQQNSTLFTVKTGLATYDNMMIKSLSVARDATSTQVLRFQATMVEIQQVATLKTVKVEPVGRATTNLGKRATTETPEAKRKQSWAYQIVNTFAPQLLKGAP